MSTLLYAFWIKVVTDFTADKFFLNPNCDWWIIFLYQYKILIFPLKYFTKYRYNGNRSFVSFNIYFTFIKRILVYLKQLGELPSSIHLLNNIVNDNIATTKSYCNTGNMKNVKLGLFFTFKNIEILHWFKENFY